MSSGTSMFRHLPAEEVDYHKKLTRIAILLALCHILTAGMSCIIQLLLPHLRATAGACAAS